MLINTLCSVLLSSKCMVFFTFIKFVLTNEGTKEPYFENRCIILVREREKQKRHISLGPAVSELFKNMFVMSLEIQQSLVSAPSNMDSF